VVQVTPLSINWGEIPVLTDVSRVISLSNESLVPSKFTAHMVCICMKIIICNACIPCLSLHWLFVILFTDLVYLPSILIPYILLAQLPCTRGYWYSKASIPY